MSTNIYILKLKDNKYYVGKTKDVNKRFQEHMSGNGSSWTQLHKPIEIINVINNASIFEEDKQVKELMNIHGIEQVRGGTYSKVKLSTEEKQTVQKEIWSARDSCTRCGYDSHFVKDCYAKIDINGNKIESNDVIEDISDKECCDVLDIVENTINKVIDYKTIIKEICDVKIIPKTTVEHIDTRGRKYIENIPEKIVPINIEQFNLLSEKYKEYVLKYFIFYKSVVQKNVNGLQFGNHYSNHTLVQHLFPENFLHNIFKEYPNILKNIIEYAIKTKNQMLYYILENKKDIYINKKTYLEFEKMAIEYNFTDSIITLKKYHIEDELFNIEEINISDDIEDENKEV